MTPVVVTPSQLEQLHALADSLCPAGRGSQAEPCGGGMARRRVRDALDLVWQVGTRAEAAMTILRQLVERAGPCRLVTSGNGVVRCRAHGVTLQPGQSCVWAEAAELCGGRAS